MPPTKITNSVTNTQLNLMKKFALIFLFGTSFLACKEDDTGPLTLENPQLELKYDSEHQFVVKQGKKTVSAADFTWTSSDIKVGTVGSDGKFVGKRIGETTVTGTSSDGQSKVSSQVTISPYSNLAKLPVLEFGASRATIESKETREFLSVLTSLDLGKQYFYKPESGNTKLRSLFYSYDNDKLDIAAWILVAKKDYDEAITYFSERYTFVGETKTNKDLVYSDFEKLDIILANEGSAGRGYVAYFVKHK